MEKDASDKREIEHVQYVQLLALIDPGIQVYTRIEPRNFSGVCADQSQTNACPNKQCFRN